MMDDDTIYGRLIVLKRSGAEGGVCDMENEQLRIGRCARDPRAVLPALVDAHPSAL